MNESDIAIVLERIDARLAFIEGVMKAITDGIDAMSQATGPQAMMMRSLGLPIDGINQAIYEAQKQV